MSADDRDWERITEEIKDRASIVNVVEDYVSLEKRGQNHWALCPFHTEDTPSFSVNPDLGIFKCFGCGKGGDVFSFIQEIEQCEFMEAMRMLSERTGVELPSRDSEETDEDSPRHNMFEVNRYAADRFRDAFESEHGTVAREYMTERGFTEEIMETFNVGFAPDGWDNLIRAMKRDEYDLRWAMKVGLIDTSEQSDGPYDKFRNRIMFPIETPSGRVVGFGGRIIDEEDADYGPKYLNSPESPIFSKRQTLYGLPQARSAIRNQDRCMLMEGYTDVIKCHQHGYETALASLGTAMTKQHVHILRRYADEVVLVYDGDEAGREAARRGGKIALENGMKPTVVLLDEGQDPADVINESPDRFGELVEERRPYIDVVFDWLVEEYDVGTSDGKTAVLKGVVPLVKELPTEVEREEKALDIARELDVREQTVLRLMNRRDGSGQSDNSDSSLSRRIKSESGASIEEFFFRCLGAQPGAFDQVMDMLALKDFTDRRSKSLFEALRRIQRSDRSFDVERWLNEISDDLVSYLAGLLNREEGQDHVERIDPVRVAQKMKSDSSRRERAKLAEALEEEDQESGAGEFDEAKKSLLEQTMQIKKEESDVEE